MKTNTKCPFCGANLIDSLDYKETGTAIFSLWVDEKGRLQYDFEDFSRDGEGKYICFECNNQLDLTEKEVIEIVKAMQQQD
jgi:hypothetical protein